MYTNWPFGAKANTRTIHMSDIFFFFSPIEKKFSAEADVKVGQCENGSRIPGSWKEIHAAVSHNVSAFQINIQEEE